MVHGNYYGIQYEIHLTKKIDFYNDLLPIWTDVRSRIEMEPDRATGQLKLIVIPYKEFDRQLYINELFRSYVRENDEYKYSCNDKFRNEEYLRSKKFIMVKFYEKIIKHEAILPEPITKEEFNELAKEMENLDKKSWSDEHLSPEEWKEHHKRYSEVNGILRFQRIIHDPEYFEEIKSLNKQLLEQVVLSDKQGECVQKVLKHPNLEGIINWHGLTLVDGFW